MRTVKFTLFFLLLGIAGAIEAQGVFSNNTQVILEKVIRDYPNHFYNIKGELIAQNHGGAEYKSKLQLAGSAACTIRFAGSQPSHELDWSCIVFESDSFAGAKEHYEQVYAQISNCIVTTGGAKTFILSGQYEQPDADKKLTRVQFGLVPGVGEMKKLKVTLALRETGEGRWQVILSVNDIDQQEAVQTSQVATVN